MKENLGELISIFSDLIPDDVVSADSFAVLVGKSSNPVEFLKNALNTMSDAFSSLKMERDSLMKKHAIASKEMDLLREVAKDLKLSLLEYQAIGELETITEVSTTLEEADQAFRRLLRKIFKHVASALYLINPETRLFELKYSENFTPQLEKRIEEFMKEGVFAWTFKEAMPAIFPYGATGASPSRSLVLLPLMAARRPIGLSVFTSRLDNEDFTVQMINLLKSVARYHAVNVEIVHRMIAFETEKRRLREMGSSLNMILDSMLHGVIVLDQDGGITHLNKTAEVLFAVSGQDVKGRSFREVFQDEMREALVKIVERAMHGDSTIDYEIAHTPEEGLKFMLGVSGTPLVKEGHKLGAVIICRDLYSAKELSRLRQEEIDKTKTLSQISEELRSISERLLRSEKLAAIGEMAAGVAHEINNPLGAISGFAQIIKMDLIQGDPNLDHLNSIQTEIARIKKIVRDLLDFAHQTNSIAKDVFEPVDINLVLDETLDIAKVGHPGLSIEKNLEPELGLIKGNHDQLKQVCLNLLENSAAALEDKTGRITVRTYRSKISSDDLGMPSVKRRVTDPPDTDFSHLRQLPVSRLAKDFSLDEEVITLEISDTGCGIHKEDLAKIFQPFFTTKKAGKGTGLGLSITHGILDNHGAMITVKSVWGEGTTFSIKFKILD